MLSAECLERDACAVERASIWRKETVSLSSGDISERNTPSVPSSMMELLGGCSLVMGPHHTAHVQCSQSLPSSPFMELEGLTGQPYCHPQSEEVGSAACGFQGQAEERNLPRERRAGGRV